MNWAASAYLDLRQVALTEDGILMRSVVNSASFTEAGFALGLLRDRVAQRTLVGALNLRETLEELPASPFLMRVDFDALAKIAGLTKKKNSYVKTGSDADGDWQIEVLGQGNLCYDIVIGADDKRAFFKPGPIGAELITHEAMDLVLNHEGLLREVVELVKNMGMVYNPHFYMTIDEWQFEHAAESLGELTDLLF